MMKNLLLLGLAFSAGLEVASAQNSRIINRNLQPVKVSRTTITDNAASNQAQTPKPAKNNKISASAYGTEIGHTFYDLPSNKGTGNRLLRHADGTISAVWTEACAADASLAYPTRGIGYNYYSGGPQNTMPYNASLWVEGTDGTCPDQFGIATTRQGWPEILTTGTNEIVISHSGSGLSMTSRPAKGTGPWAPTVNIPHTTNINGVTGNVGTWPRAISNGNTIHMLFTVNNTPVPVINGVSGPILYNRSDDGGATWSKQNIALPGLVGPASGTGAIANGYDNIGADDYAIAVRGNTVAIVAGSMGDPWTLWKSTDNGENFTRTIIDRITEIDTFMTAAGDTGAFMNDGVQHVLIDNNNMVHVWNGEIAVTARRDMTVGGTKQWVIDADAAGLVSWFPETGQSMLYWNESMPAGMIPQTIANIADPRPGQVDTWIANDPNKRSQYVFKGMVTMPNAAIDAAGNIYLVYSAIVRGASVTASAVGQPFRDLYVMKRFANSGEWSVPLNIPVVLQAFPVGTDFQTAAENFEESIHPNVAREVAADNILHLTWQSDGEPGLSVNGDLDAPSDNAIVYKPLDVNIFPFVLGVKNEVAAYVNGISAFPNPTTGLVNIQVDLKKASNVQVKVTNLMGQEVAAVAASKMTAGANTVSVDVSKLASGIYLYTVTSDNFTVTNRIMKK